MMPLWLQIAVGILTVAGGIIGFGMAVGYISYFITRAQVFEQTRSLENRINSIENSLAGSFAPFITLLKTEQLNNPFSKEQNERKKELLHLLEIKQLSKLEARELRKLLQIELDDAQKTGNTAIAIAIIAVLLLLAFVLSKE